MEQESIQEEKVHAGGQESEQDGVSRGGEEAAIGAEIERPGEALIEEEHPADVSARGVQHDGSTGPSCACHAAGDAPAVGAEGDGIELQEDGETHGVSPCAGRAPELMTSSSHTFPGIRIMRPNTSLLLLVVFIG